MTILRFFLGVVEDENLELIQLDVKKTFLHDDLKEEIYMEQPKGFVASGQEESIRPETGTATMVQEDRRLHPVDGFSKSDEHHYLFIRTG
mgnify:CR=1 FL=1